MTSWPGKDSKIDAGITLDICRAKLPFLATEYRTGDSHPVLISRLVSGRWCIKLSLIHATFENTGIPQDLLTSAIHNGELCLHWWHGTNHDGEPRAWGFIMLKEFDTPEQALQEYFEKIQPKYFSKL